MCVDLRYISMIAPNYARPEMNQIDITAINKYERHRG